VGNAKSKGVFRNAFLSPLEVANIKQILSATLPSRRSYFLNPPLPESDSSYLPFYLSINFTL